MKKNAPHASGAALAFLAPNHVERRYAAGAAGGVVGGCCPAVGQPAVSAAAGPGAGQAHYHRRAAGLYGCHALAALRCKSGAYSGGASGCVIIGIPVGIAMGLSPTVRGILDPLIELYRPVPPLAYLPLMVIWFGIGETSKILLIYLAIFAPVAMSALAGVKSAQQVRIRAAQSLGASRTQVLLFVILPGALPEILTGLRIGLGVGWSTLVAAELIAATHGLGFMVQSAGEFLATDVVLAGIAVIAAIAFGLELGLRALQRRLTPWHGEIQ